MKKRLMILQVVLIALLMVSVAFSGQRDREKVNPAEREIPGASNLLPARPERVVSLPFFDDFESGQGGWTADGLFNLAADAQNYSVLSPDINPNLVILPDNGHLPSAYSGNHMWWFGVPAHGTFIGVTFNPAIQYPLNGGESDSIQAGSLVTPAIDLSGVSSAQLNFKTWWEIEGVDVDAYDMMYVEISTDNGATFEPLGHGWINPLNDVDGEEWKPYSSGGLGAPGVWLNQIFDLSSFTGNTVYIRFRFNTEDELYNGFRGWLIDDVRVSADALPAPQITSIDPDVAFPGELVNVSGSNFINGAAVTVGGDAVAAIISTNLIQFEAPYVIAGSYDVTVTNPDGQSATLTNGLTITNDPPPEIYEILPDSVEYGNSAAVTIYGYNFMTGTVVEVGGYPLQNQTLVTSDEIQGTTSASLPMGHHNVVVTNPDGQYDRLVLAFNVYSTSGISDPSSSAIPAEFRLEQNYPNPFNPSTTISFQLPQAAGVRLVVYNLLGEQVDVILDRQMPAGAHSVSYAAKHLNSGVYFYELQAGDFKAMKKFILMK